MDTHICLDTHKQTHTETYPAGLVHAQMLTCDIGQPGENGEAQWVVTVSYRATTPACIILVSQFLTLKCLVDNNILRLKCGFQCVT